MRIVAESLKWDEIHTLLDREGKAAHYSSLQVNRFVVTRTHGRSLKSQLGLIAAERSGCQRTLPGDMRRIPALGDLSE